MCPDPEIATYRKLASDRDVPQNIQDAALDHIEEVTIARKNIDNAKVAIRSPTSPDPPVETFNCTIYSLENKRLWERDEKPNDPLVTNPSQLTDLPGKLVQDTNNVEKDAEGRVKTDPGRQLAWNHIQQAYNFYKTVFKRNSLDGKGIEIRASIHYARGLDQAYWTSLLNQIVLGDAGMWDGRGWLQPTEKQLKEEADIAKQAKEAEAEAKKERNEEKKAELEEKARRLRKLLRGYASLATWMINYDIDTIGHELTHGVVSFTAKLGVEQEYKSPEEIEAKTLNEHIADCFAIMLKHWVNKHTAETGNWDFSPNAWAPNVLAAKGWTENYCRTFRIPKDPSKSPDDDPKHWDDREKFSTKPDCHTNCGIGNHAFYTAAREFKGNTWEKPGQIWYDALVDPEFKIATNQTFEGWRKLTIKHAKDGDKGVIERAWNAVGVRDAERADTTK